MNTIDTLRSAAARLWDAAGGGTEGQRTFYTDTGQVWSHSGGPRLVATVPRADDGALIAIMGPSVARALAGWLEDEADWLVQAYDRGDDAIVMPSALILALRVLGEEG